MKNIQELSKEWLHAKNMEAEWRSKRLDAENAILKEAGELPTKGTTTLENSMKVSTNVRVSFDQEALMDLYRQGEISESDWPFEKTFKPVSADLAYLEKNKPELFAKIDACATTKPSKPSFKIVEK